MPFNPFFSHSSYLYTKKSATSFCTCCCYFTPPAGFPLLSSIHLKNVRKCLCCFENFYMMLLLFDWLVFFPSSMLSVKMKCEHNRTEYKKILYHINAKEREREMGWDWLAGCVKVGDVMWMRVLLGGGWRDFPHDGMRREKSFIHRRRQKILRWVVLFLCWMGFKRCGKIRNLIEWAQEKKKKNKWRGKKNERKNKKSLHTI
jgi:hypothetical protein